MAEHEVTTGTVVAALEAAGMTRSYVEWSLDGKRIQASISGIPAQWSALLQPRQAVTLPVEPDPCPNCATQQAEAEKAKGALARLIADVRTFQAARRKVTTALLREAESALSPIPTPPTDATCPECRGAMAVSNDLGLNWKPCPNPIHRPQRRESESDG